MQEVVTPRKVLKLNTIARYNFIRGPLLWELDDLFVRKKLLFIEITTMDHLGHSYDIGLHVSVRPTKLRIPFERGYPALLRAKVVEAFTPLNRLVDQRWQDKSSVIEVVVYPNHTDRNGFFIIAGGAYTLLP